MALQNYCHHILLAFLNHKVLVLLKDLNLEFRVLPMWEIHL